MLKALQQVSSTAGGKTSFLIPAPRVHPAPLDDDRVNPKEAPSPAPQLEDDEEDEPTWNRAGFPLIRAGKVNVFAAIDSCNVNVIRKAGNLFSDHFEFIVTCNPLKALTLFTFEFLVIVIVFSGLYYAGGDECILDEVEGLGIGPMDIRSAVFLSVHTQTTAGYGVLYPLSWWCNLMVLAHIWTCTIFTALVTSILLLNITRPNVDVVFSENAIICNLNLHGKMRGKDPELHFQIMKDSNYSVANVGISANMWDYSGWPVVKRQALALNASTLSWMEYGVHNVHVVDSKSPLRSVVNQIRATGTVPNSFNILVTINCVQSATGSVLTRMHSYCQPNIQFNKRFKPLLMDEGDHVVLRSVEESHELMDDLSLLSVRRPTLKQVAMYIIADNKAQAQKEKARARKVSMRSAANTIIG